jgi:hypothetical protein
MTTTVSAVSTSKIRTGICSKSSRVRTAAAAGIRERGAKGAGPMAITRRQVLAAAARTAAWPQANAADQEHAVFRRLKATGEGVLFGYADRGRARAGHH